MAHRLEDVPIYAQRSDAIAAVQYNLWRRARRHYGHPLRLELPGLSGLELILDDEAWVVVDARQFDLPVLAWVEFQDHGRALHTPVPCKLNYYHFAASRLRGKVLDMVQQALEDRLHAR
ncbi:MAG: hypothetical protein CVV05_12830 [Gammaproteobacteria bacterium HGW-Gammaproteobacteria-1]|jgi:hypothetical protein|nr:MAG: hypothetical protein CVV05_12830 [Gammaproteobacteria bacterium HGW-Gammaproteobacteria-1]